MSSGEGTRRKSHVDMPVAYAAVGASRAPDLLRFPPEGSTPYREELRLGSGQERFILASSLLMTWGAQRGAGATVTENERGAGSEYQGPQFDSDGVPQAAAEPEEHFGPNGEPFVVAGTRATLSIPGNEDRAVLVIYTITEARVIGFAWGTSDENGAVGEQLFTVELRDDDTVWAVARGFLAAPKGGLFGLRARAEVRGAVAAVRAQLAALLPGAQPSATLGASGDAVADVAPEPTPPAEASEEPAAPAEVVDEAPVTAVIELSETDAEEAETEAETAGEAATEVETEAAAEVRPEVPSTASDAPTSSNSHQRRPSSPRSA